MPTVYKTKNKFNRASFPVFPPNITKKTKILSLEISEHGRSGGVVFVETDQGSFVLKANNETPQDLFFNELGILLDVSVPMMSSVACYEQKFKALLFLIEKYCHQDEVLFARLKNKLDFPFYEVMEYIPSVGFMSIGAEKFKQNMLTEYKLVNIGICIGFDLVINNNDRFALVWRGEGNMNNILVEVPSHMNNNLQKARDREDLSVGLGDYLYIDHDGHMLNIENGLAKQNTDKYMEIVNQFQLNVVQYLREQNSEYAPQFNKLIKQIQFFTQFQINESHIVLISYGIIYATKRFIDSYESKQIQKLHNSIIKPTNTKSKQENYWNEYWNNQYKKVCFEFCQLMYIKVSAIYSTYSDLINDVMPKVNKILQAQTNRRRRQSQVLGKGLGQEEQKADINQRGESRESEDEGLGETVKKGKEEDDEKKESGKRRWREKLEVFKIDNYK